MLPAETFDISKIILVFFPDKAEMEQRSNFEKFEIVYLWRHILH